MIEYWRAKGAREIKEGKWSSIEVTVSSQCSLCGFTGSQTAVKKFEYAIYFDGTDNLMSFALPNAMNAASGTLKNLLTSRHIKTKGCHNPLNFH